MIKRENRKTIKEWEAEKGIKIKNTKVFYGKNQVWNTKYSEKAFLNSYEQYARRKSKKNI